MRCAVIKDGIVINLIVADANVDAPPYEDTFLVNIDDTVQMGWHWDGQTFSDPTPPVEPVPPPVRVPANITRRQCALQLLAMQVITPTEALAMTKSAELPAPIAAIFDQSVANGTMTAEQRILAEIDFAAINYYRSNSLLGMMGLTEEGIDQFFIAAAQL